MAAQLRLFVLSLLLACSGGTSAVPEVVERPVTPPLDEPDTVRAVGLLAKGALATAKVPASSIEAPPKSATFQCGRVGGQPLEEFEPLLGDRLRIQRVSGSRQEPAAWNVMGAPEPLETETRLFYDVGEEKFVMMSYELFRLAGEDFVEAARVMRQTRFPQHG